MGVLRWMKNGIASGWVTLIWFLRQWKNENFRNYISRVQRSRGLVIFANGPSLSSVVADDTLLNTISAQADIMMLNDSPMSESFEQIKPRYYIIADPTYWLDTHETNTVREPVLNAILRKTSWPMTFFVPFHALKHLDFWERFRSNGYITVVPYHMSIYTGFRCLKYFLYRRGLAMPRVQNVVVAAIFNGINMGYRHVELYGVENSWTAQMCVDEQNRVCQYNRHYYDREPELKPWLGLDGKPYKMHNILRDLAHMFDSYWQVREYADMEHCRVINKTKGSFIDAFEREDIL